jgi:DNA-binding NtrC family response regulator
VTDQLLFLVGEQVSEARDLRMAKVMICDDDRVMAQGLVDALRAAGHEAEACRHTMDMLRGAEAGQFDLIAFGLDMAGFGRAGAVDALCELAPRVPLIALHERPSEVMRAAARAKFAAVLPRSLAIEDFMYAVACALSEHTAHRREPAA